MPAGEPRRRGDLAEPIAAGGEAKGTGPTPAGTVPNASIREGPDPRAVLIDFGLCRRGLAAPPGSRLRGSLPYMAPEYYRGGDLGPWTDVYALGATLYRLATGRLPRPEANAWDPPVPPSALRPGLPADFDRIVLRCLAVDPRSRYRSGEDVTAALAALGSGRAAASGPRTSALVTVGRERELEAAARLLDAVLGKRPGPPALLVAAPSGMGMSHYLREVKVRAQTRGISAYLEAGFPGSPGAPGSALRSLAAHIPAGEDRDRWEDFLARLVEPRRPIHGASEGERRLRRASEIARAAGSVREPVLIAVDDLALHDEVSIALVIDLVRFLAAAPASCRPPVGIVAGIREEGLAIAAHAGSEGKKRSPDRAVPKAAFRVREMELNLLATWANVALRSFEYERAARDFGRALEIAEAIGSPVNAAVILSNLGIVHSQCDRSAEAIRALREAERLSIRLDEGPSLVSIYGNLAVLHSRRGEFAEMDCIFGEADRLGPTGIGRRQELFVEHTRGLALLHGGRHGEARPHVEAALRIAAEMGDRHVTAFDEVYRAECLLFEARYGEARRELDRLCGRDRPGRPRRLALARRALLAALAGDEEGRCAAAKSHDDARGERPVPFLDAGEDLLLAWAASIAGDGAGRARLDAAEAYFRDHDLGPALALARWVRAEGLFLAGDLDGARETLAGVEPTGALLGVLRPLLAARLLLPPAGRDEARAADLLAEAGAALVGSPLPEWAARIAALGAACLADPRPALAEAERIRRGIAGELPARERRRFVRLPHWESWTAAGKGRRRRRGSGGAGVAEGSTGSTGSTGPRTASLDGTRAVPATRAGLVARSRGMRKVAAVLDRLRGSDLPVLIAGETGTGKEMIARIIHAESLAGLEDGDGAIRTATAEVLAEGVIRTPGSPGASCRPSSEPSKRTCTPSAPRWPWARSAPMLGKPCRPSRWPSTRTACDAADGSISAAKKRARTMPMTRS